MEMIVKHILPLLICYFVLGTGFSNIEALALIDENITLFENGRSDYVICVEKDALDSVIFSADEMQKYFKKATGIELPIVHEALGTGKNIFIGESAASIQMGIQTDKLCSEGYLIAVKDNNLFLVGKDWLF